MARIKFYNQTTGQWEYADKSIGNTESGGNGAHCSMATLASGTYTPVDEENAEVTGVGFELRLPDVTLAELRKYKAVFFQFSSDQILCTSGSISLNLNATAGGATSSTPVADLLYGTKTARAGLLFVDAEHYAAMVVAQTSPSNLASKPYATIESNARAAMGYCDFSTKSDDLVVELKVNNAPVNVPISYEIIGLAEEAANFT